MNLCRVVSVALATSLIFGCAFDVDAGGDVEVGQIAQPLAVVGLNPVPCEYDQKTTEWNETFDGSQPLLSFADAMASCGWFDEGFDAWGIGAHFVEGIANSNGDVVGVYDPLPMLVASKMAGSHGTSSWIENRKRDDYAGGLFSNSEGDLTLSNCVPHSDSSSSTGRRAVSLKKVEIKQSIFSPGDIPASFSLDPTGFVASRQLRLPAISLCIAEHLRAAVPGAAGAEALLLDAGSQRELLELVRQYSQMSLLQYTTLASVFAGGTTKKPATAAWHTIPLLKEWAGSASRDQLVKMGNDFAKAMLIYTTVSEELASLYGRSASAMAPRGGAIGSVAGERWGAGSWLQRLSSLMYGGSPLAELDESPWQHPLGYKFLAPTFAQFPYADVPEADAQVENFMTLLRRYDLIEATYLWCGFLLSATSIGEAWYEALELEYRRDRCLDGQGTSGDCKAVLPADEEEFAIYLDRGLTSDHAIAAATRFRSLYGAESSTSYSGCMGSRPGSHRLAGNLTVTSPTGYFNRSEMTLDPNARFVPRGGRDRAAVFTDVGPVHIVSAEDLGSERSAGKAGFRPLQHRLAGVIPTLSATRLALAQALHESPELATSFLAHATEIANVASSYGGTSLSLTPPPPQNGIGIDIRFYAPPGPFGGPFEGTGQFPVFNRTSWDFGVAPARDDPFWQGEEGDEWEVFVVTNEPRAGDLAASPSSSIAQMSFGRIVAEHDGVVLGDPKGDEIPYRQAFLTPPEAGQSTVFIWRRTDAERRALGIAYGLCAGDNTCAPEPGGEVLLIADRLKLNEPRTYEGGGDYPGKYQDENVERTEGRYFGGDTGWFSRLLTRQLAQDTANPSETAYDGFGLPNRWVPPMSAELVGGAPGTHTFQHYLNAARSAAAGATLQARAAIEGLIEEDVGENTQQAGETNALGEIAAVKQGLCGRDNPDCEVDLEHDTPVTEDLVPALNDVEWNEGVYDNKVWTDGEVDKTFCAALFKTAWPAASDTSGLEDEELRDAARASVHANVKYSKRLMDCFVLSVINRIENTKFTLATTVKDRLPTSTSGKVNATASVPSFEDYSGGELQDAFIFQWSAIVGQDEALKQLYALVEAASSSLDLADEQFDASEQALDNASCGFWDVAADVGMSLLPVGGSAGLQAASKNGMSAGGWAGAGLTAASVTLSTISSASIGCQQGEANLRTAQQAAVAAGRQAMAQVLAQGAYLLTTLVGVVGSGMNLEQLKAQAEVAKDTWELEKELVAAGNLTSYGLSRRYRAYDLWRAKALLDSARAYALAARRGIEAYYVVDLAGLSADEPFVVAPALWANEVYEYDLSLPTALGTTSTAGLEEEGGIYADKVGDYVSNLEAVLRGWAVERPTSIVNEDVEVLSLPGLAPRYEFDEETGDSTTVAFSGEWLLLCPLEGGGAEWTPVALEGADNTCAAGRPLSAKTNFMLDPWGQVDVAIAPDPFSHRYNARWTRLAVNLVGAGLIDCTDAQDRYSCEQSRYRSFNLRQTGIPWVTDYDGRWRMLRVPVGAIEGGKAIADERFLNPLEHGWDTPYVSTVARTEFHWRPLGGRYEMELEVGPHMNLERLERVQLLVGTTYWTRP